MWLTQKGKLMFYQCLQMQWVLARKNRKSERRGEERTGWRQKPSNKKSDHKNEQKVG
jgi:hypothetical protein